MMRSNAPLASTAPTAAAPNRAAPASAAAAMALGGTVRRTVVVLLVSVLLSSFSSVTVLGTKDDLSNLVQRMNEDILEFKVVVEDAYNNRCSSDSLRGCYASNYDHCLSDYPNEFCPASRNGLYIPECGKGKSCNGLYDYSVSTVRLPENVVSVEDRNPSNPKVVETVCYTQTFESYLKAKHENSTAFWSEQGNTEPPWMYYGAQDGAFRIFPGRHSKECGTYDPRGRPWYIAAVPWHIVEQTGSKDVVLMIDVSRSMKDDGKLSAAKASVNAIIRSLALYDWVAVVAFDDDAVSLGFDTLVRASDDNKKVLTDAVNKLTWEARTNYYDAFDLTFQLLRDSSPKKREFFDGCPRNVAVMFVTDGDMNTPDDEEDDIVELINDNVASMTFYSIFMFTYHLGSGGNIPKQISCETGGMFKRVPDAKDLRGAMLRYVEVFAIFLGRDEFKDMTAWVGPYAFSTSGFEGITVSSMVFDRQTEPPMFLGAVGMDMSVKVIQDTYARGGEEKPSEYLDVLREELLPPSTNTGGTCYSFNFTACELELIRYHFGGEESRCISNDTSTCLTRNECPGMDEYPTQLWKNTANKDKTYEERTCCEVGGNGPSDKCPAKDFEEDDEGGLSDGAIFGIIMGSLVLLEVVGCYYFYYRKPNKEE